MNTKRGAGEMSVVARDPQPLQCDAEESTDGVTFSPDSAGRRMRPDMLQRVCPSASRAGQCQQKTSLGKKASVGEHSISACSRGLWGGPCVLASWGFGDVTIRV
jgi:hypothetical protein